MLNWLDSPWTPVVLLWVEPLGQTLPHRMSYVLSSPSPTQQHPHVTGLCNRHFVPGILRPGTPV